MRYRVVVPLLLVALAGGWICGDSCQERREKKKSARVRRDGQGEAGCEVLTTACGSRQAPKNNARQSVEYNPAIRAGDLLWEAICQVESGGDRYAWKKKEGAAGIAQIREIYLADANRIVGSRRFVLADRWDEEKSLQMFEIVRRHYARDGTDEEASRIHNGGPRGMSKASTVKYWKKVQAAMAQLQGERDEHGARGNQ